MSGPPAGRELARHFWFGAARKAYVAFKEGRLAMSPAAWLRLLRLHYEELTAPAPVPTILPSNAPEVTANTETPQISPNTEPRLVFADLDRIVFDQWLESGGRLGFPAADQPLVSVLIVLHNRAELALRCLRALTATALPIEVVLVDNASTDNTARLLDRLDSVTVIRNASNEGFIVAVNQGAARARGDLLLLLNSDAEVLPGSLEAAVEALQSADSIGAVVGKLVHMDGRLQEAGSIVWRDGACHGYGRGDDPLAAPYMFRRPVDFGSGAFLLTRRQLFLDQGGFDERFKPAYYEDADYCLRLWQSGRQVIYEPRAVVMHVEFASSSNADAAVEMMIERRSRFAAKHGAWLRSNAWQQQVGLLVARSRCTTSQRLLFVEDRVPHEKLGSGYPRSRAMLQAALELGHQVTLYPVLEPDESWDEAYSDLPREVELMLRYGQAGLDGFLKERLSDYDAAIVSRPHNMQRMKQALSSFTAPVPPLIYDAEALFASRELGRRRLAGIPVSGEEAGRLFAEELSLASDCDAILAVSRMEAQRFVDAGYLQVRVLGNSIRAQPTRRPFDERAGFLFVGAFVDDAAPNTNGIMWFVEDVMPRIRAKSIAPVHLTISGRNESARVASIAGPVVTILGMVDNLAPLYDRVRVFIAPTRFGAGIPLKVHQAAAFGVPVVSTSLVAEQLGWRDGEELLVADDAESFASQCRRLYDDGELWQRLRSAALRRVSQECQPEAFRRTLARSLSSARTARRATRPPAA